MGCCTGCDTGVGCESSSGCGDGACATPQFPGLTFITSALPFPPSTGVLASKPPAPKPGDADRGGVLAADYSRVDYVPPPAPPAFITPPPPFWAVVNVAGSNGLRLRQTPSMAGAVLGAAPNGARVWVRKANVPEDGAAPGAVMQWWEVALWTGDAPGVIGFMRAIGPQGEKNFTVPALPSTGFDATGDQNGESTMGCCGTKAQAAFNQAMPRMPDDAARLHQAQAEAMQAAAAFASTGVAVPIYPFGGPMRAIGKRKRGVRAGRANTGAVLALGKRRPNPLYISPKIASALPLTITRFRPLEGPPGCEAAAQRFNAADAQGAPQIVIESLRKQYENCAAAARGLTPDTILDKNLFGAPRPSTGAIPAFLRPYVSSVLSMVPSLASMLPGEVTQAQTPYAIEHFASFAPTLHAIANELGAAHAALENAYRAQAATTTPGGVDRNIPGLEKQLADVLGTRLEMLLAAAQPGPMFTYPTPHTAARWLSDLLRKYSHDHAADVVDRVLYLASQQPGTVTR